MITVHKFILGIGRNVIPLPYDSTALTVQLQDNKLALWVKVDTEDIRPIKGIFHVCVTGAPLPEGNLNYISTILMDGGRFVAHVFEELE